MMLNYSFKVLIANFSTMWKMLLYRLIVLVLTVSLAVGLMLPTLNYLIGLIRDTGFFSHISEFISGIFSGKLGSVDYSELFRQDLVNIAEVFLTNISRLLLTYLYLILILCVSRFLNGVADYALCDVVNNNMAACAKFGFTACVIRNLAKSTRYSLARMMFTIPFDVAILTFIGYLFIALFSPLGFFMPFFVMLVAIILISFRNTLFSGWLPAVVADGLPIFQGLKKGVKAVFSRFWKVYASWVILLFIVIFVGSMVTLFTCGVGIIVIVPTIIVMTVIFYLVMYYGTEGRRYYIDQETIITPKVLRDKEQAVSYEIKNNVFFDNTGAHEDEDEDGKQ